MFRIGDALVQVFSDLSANRQCPRFCVNAVPLVMARWSGQVRFCLLPYARIIAIIWLARTAVKAERSEFILSLDGGRSRPYRFSPGMG